MIDRADFEKRIAAALRHGARRSPPRERDYAAEAKNIADQHPALFAEGEIELPA